MFVTQCDRSDEMDTVSNCDGWWIVRRLLDLHRFNVKLWKAQWMRAKYNVCEVDIDRRAWGVRGLVVSMESGGRWIGLGLYSCTLDAIKSVSDIRLASDVRICECHVSVRILCVNRMWVLV